MLLTKINDELYSLDMPTNVLDIIQMALDAQIQDCSRLLRRCAYSQSAEALDAIDEVRLDTLNIQNYFNATKKSFQ